MNWQTIRHTTCAVAATLLLAACTEADSDPTPAGMAAVEIHLVAPYHMTTRATGDPLDPVADVELIHDYRVAFVDGDGVVEELVSGDAHGAEDDTFRFLLPPGQYTVYGFANLTPAQWTAIGIAKGEALPDLTTKTLPTTNGWTQNIPMTSHAGGQTITVREAENQSFEVEIVRAMAKIEMQFSNLSTQQMDIVGYEIYPLTTTAVSLLEPADEATIATADATAYTVDLSAAPIVLKSNETKSAYVYVNETNATATAIHNQYSIRLKTVRHRDATTEVVDYRYGFTVNKETSGPISTEADARTVDGFTYIHRNDWIRLPIAFTDWAFRIEALPFPPIAGFQSRVEAADALSITFNTGGYIFLRPMFRKNSDAEGVWRSFDDSDVVFRLPAAYTDVTATHAECIDNETGTGIILNGDLDIFELKAGSDDQYALLERQTSGDIVGYLTNEARYGMVTVTLKIRLDGFDYQFNYNIIKKN